MDQNLWCRLPEDCLERVIFRLPLPAVARLRCVCKRWNSLILSSHAITRFPCCFLSCTQTRAACIYAISLNCWYLLSLPAISSPTALPHLSVLSAAGSLLLLGNQVSECSVLFVCNPFNGKLRQLPAMATVRFIHKLAITLTSNDIHSYRIMAAGENSIPLRTPHVYQLSTEVYDSDCNLWRRAEDPLPDAKFGSDPGVWCSGVFFCITELPYGVVSFDPISSSWREVEAPMPRCLSSPSLVELKGKLLMVGRIHRRSTTESINIWELRSCQSDWVEIHRMPTALCSEFVQMLSSHTPFICVGLGMENLICLTTHLTSHMLLFNASTHTWRWLPRDPLFPKYHNSHLLGFALEPRLDIQP